MMTGLRHYNKSFPFQETLAMGVLQRDIAALRAQLKKERIYRHMCLLKLRRLCKGAVVQDLAQATHRLSTSE